MKTNRKTYGLTIKRNEKYVLRIKFKNNFTFGHFYEFDKYETNHIFIIKYIITKWDARQNFIVNTSLFTPISLFFYCDKKL